MRPIFFLLLAGILFLNACSHTEVDSWNGAELDGKSTGEFVENDVIDGEISDEEFAQLIAEGEEQLLSDEASEEMTLAKATEEDKEQEEVTHHEEETAADETEGETVAENDEDIGAELAAEDGSEVDSDYFASQEENTEVDNIASTGQTANSDVSEMLAELEAELQEEATEEEMASLGLESESSKEKSNTSQPPVKAVSRSLSYPRSGLPEVELEAFQVGYRNLNRYLILRAGHDPNSVSELIYGDAEFASKLRAWNSGTWRPGRVIYYESLSNPDENHMRSYYESRGLNQENYIVQAGEQLSTIAEQQYGDVRSWRELAILNQFESPDDLAVGQTIALNPQDLRAEPLDIQPQQLASLSQTNSNSPESLDNQALEAETTQSQAQMDSHDELPSVFSDPQELAKNEESATKEDPKEAKKQGLASLEIVQFARRNAINIFIALLLGSLAGAGYYFANAKNRNNY